jgi:Flp pilus assembly protein TadG
VSFVLAFPIFLTIVAIIVQMALMVNAKVVVTHAADSAARAAATSLPDGKPENVERAAWMALAPLSPQAQSPVAAEAAADYDALRRMGVDVPESFPARYTYATEATAVSWSPDVDFSRSEGQEVEVTVTYRFQLTVPGAMKMAAADDDTVAGVKGRFWEVTARSRVQTAHGRKARAYDDGWPR